MNEQTLIDVTAEYVKAELLNEVTGHDWWHVYRVWQLAQRIGKQESANMIVVELSALLHDIADYKFHDGDHEKGTTVARQWLESQNADEELISKVCECIKVCSFSKGIRPENIEQAVVQDADRLEALGAIGIARAFATGVHFKQALYDPEKPKESQDTTIGHFYYKLLNLKEQMNTSSGLKIATERDEYMRDFLDRFYKEWEGEV